MSRRKLFQITYKPDCYLRHTILIGALRSISSTDGEMTGLGHFTIRKDLIGLASSADKFILKCRER